MKLSAAILLFLFLAGCASTGNESVFCGKTNYCKSTIISKKLIDGSIEQGVTYSLPHQLLEFNLERTKVTKDKLEEEQKKASESEEKARESVQKQEKIVIKDLETKLSSAASPEAKAKIALEIEIAKLDLIVLKNKYIDAKNKLDAADKKVSEFKGEHFQDDIKLIALDPQADNNNRFVAKINKSPFTSETVEIKTTQNGLLSGGSGTSEGQIDEIFVSLVKSISAFRGLPIMEKPLAFTGIPPKESKDCTLEELKFRHTFDLRDENFAKNLNDKLKEKKLCYEVKLASDNPSKTKPIIKEEKEEEKEEYLDGLVYPRKISLQFDLYKIEGSSKSYTDSFYPVVIDNRTLGVIPLNKGYFATNNYDYEFKDGLLTKYKSVTPNELIAFLNMFPDAAKSLISIPADIIRLRIDYSSAEEGYYQAQQAALQARLAYEKAMEQQ